MMSASSIPLSSTLRVLSRNVNEFQTKVSMRKRKQTRIVALGSLLRSLEVDFFAIQGPHFVQRRIVRRARGACQSTGTAWTGHSMKKDVEEWHWHGKHPNGPYSL